MHLEGEDLLALPRIPTTRRSSYGMQGGLEAVVDQVNSVPTSRQKEEICVLKKIDQLRKSRRIVDESERVVAKQQVLELHGFFEESLRSFFPRGVLELLPRGVPGADSHVSGHFYCIDY